MNCFKRCFSHHLDCTRLHVPNLNELKINERQYIKIEGKLTIQAYNKFFQSSEEKKNKTF